ncbi:type IV conjugative transfer system protein TraL [Photobacterium phosphoreum]|uniref:type IV conjugative transfer system protein TraL n=1 Tax=Photobacterium phosphoreum TaxID=659 RepID=UPI000D161B59|nr:type IV conjugative transfer system protein TraL [Photobacterium phosphoreum]PSW21575.1 type IV conjugative transfer system protein TraL [Photobacterium phosphoreum]
MTTSAAYFIPRLLDMPPSIAGVPYTEIAPAFLVFLAFLLVGHEMIGFMCAVPLWMGMKYINTKYGQYALIEAFYTFLPRALSNKIFTYSPPSSYRYWRR